MDFQKRAMVEARGHCFLPHAKCYELMRWCHLQVGGGQRSLSDFKDCITPDKRWVPLLRYSGKGRGHVGLTVQFIPDEESKQETGESQAGEVAPEEVEEEATGE